MSGLIRGKRLVWVFDGQRYAEAESQFGRYHVYITASGLYKWDLSSFVDDLSIHEGHEETVELAQSACQADHDSRAMASVEVVPFEWVDGAVQAGPLSLVVLSQPPGLVWRVQYGKKTLQFGAVPDRDDAAITAAEQFVRQLVMGVQS